MSTESCPVCARPWAGDLRLVVDRRVAGRGRRLWFLKCERCGALWHRSVLVAA